MTIRQPFDLALSLETGQAFRWRRVREEEIRHQDLGDPPAPVAEKRRSLVLRRAGGILVHLRQTGEGLEYRGGGRDGERDDVNLDLRIRDYFRLDDEIGEVYAELVRHRAVGPWPSGGTRG